MRFAFRTIAAADLGGTPLAVPTAPSVRMADPSTWIPDEQRQECCGCGSDFTFFRRRHHCRVCGDLFCDPCTADRYQDQRVCRACFHGAVGSVTVGGGDAVAADRSRRGRDDLPLPAEGLLEAQLGVQLGKLKEEVLQAAKEHEDPSPRPSGPQAPAVTAAAVPMAAVGLSAVFGVLLSWVISWGLDIQAFRPLGRLLGGILPEVRVAPLPPSFPLSPGAFPPLARCSSPDSLPTALLPRVSPERRLVAAAALAIHLGIRTRLNGRVSPFI